MGREGLHKSLESSSELCDGAENAWSWPCSSGRLKYSTERSVPSVHRPGTMTITAADGFGFGAAVNLCELISRYLCQHVGTLARMLCGLRSDGQLSSIDESVPSLCQHRGMLILWMCGSGSDGQKHRWVWVDWTVCSFRAASTNPEVCAFGSFVLRLDWLRWWEFAVCFLLSFLLPSLGRINLAWGMCLLSVLHTLTRLGCMWESDFNFCLLLNHRAYVFESGRCFSCGHTFGTIVFLAALDTDRLLVTLPCHASRIFPARWKSSFS